MHEFLKAMHADGYEIEFLKKDGTWAKPRDPKWLDNTVYRMKPGPAAAREMRSLVNELALCSAEDLNETTPTGASRAFDLSEMARAIVGGLRRVKKEA